MPVKGTFAALQKLKPIDIDWGKVAESGVKREDILDARKKAEAKIRQEARDKIDYNVLEPVITGIDSLDKGLTIGIQEASTMQHEDFKKALNNPKYADSSEYKIRAKNLNNYSKNIKAFSDGTTELAGKVIAKSQDGTLSAWDDELLQTMNGAYVSEAVKFGVKQDGSVLATIALTDQDLITDDNSRGFVKDEDGKIKMIQTTPAEVFKGLGTFSITADVDILKIATDIGTELGKSIETDIEGYTITTEQSWEKKKEETRKIARGLLGSPKSPTALAKRLWADEMGEESRSLTETNMKTIEDKLLEKIKPFYDEEIKKTVAFSARSADISRVQKAKKDRISPVIVPDKTGAPVVKIVDGKKANVVSFGRAVNIMDTDAKIVQIENLYITDDGSVYSDKTTLIKGKGEPVYDEEGNVDMLRTILEKKGWKQTEETEVPVSDTELTNLVKDKNIVDEGGNMFKDSKAFRDYLKKQKEGMPKGKSTGDKVKTESGNTYN